jgi:hypothetical protein
VESLEAPELVQGRCLTAVVVVFFGQAQCGGEAVAGLVVISGEHVAHA